MKLDDTTTAEEAQDIWETATDAARQIAMHALLREASRLQAEAKLRGRQKIIDKAEKLTIAARAQVAAMVLLGAENITEIVELVDRNSDQLLEADPAWQRLEESP